MKKEKTDKRKENISKSMIDNTNALKYQGKRTDELIYKLCLLGLIDREIANILDISEETLNQWKKKYPSVSESILNGKVIADANVSASLYKRAIGFEHDSVKIFQYEGAPVLVPFKEYFAPDVAAQGKWLAARQRKTWGQKVDLAGGVNEDGTGKPIEITMNLGKEI